MIYGIIGIWLVCGALAYGQSVGACKEEFGRVLGVTQAHLVISAMMSLYGPFGLAATISNNRSIHGKWWYKPRFQFRTSPPTDPRFR